MVSVIKCLIIIMILPYKKQKMEEENLETSQELSIDTWTNNITDNTILSY